MSEEKEHKSVRKIVIGGGQSSGKMDAVLAPTEKEVSPPPVNSLDVQETKSNKRLSNETLFAFALPEAVLEEAAEAAKKSSPPEKKSEPNNTKPAPINNKQEQKLNPFTAMLIGMLIAVLFVFAGRFAGEIVEYLNSRNQTANNESANQKVEEIAEAPSDIQVKSMEKEPSLTEKEKALDSQVGLTPDESALDSKLLSSDIATLVGALKEVGEKKPSRLTKRLIEISSNPNDSVRALVVRVFVDKSFVILEEDRAAVISMILSRLNDRDEIVRGFSAKALSNVGDGSVISALEARLQVEQSALVQKLLQSSINQLKRQG